MKDLVVIDLETGPETPERLSIVEPEFEPAKNLRDPEKIAANIAEKRQEWLAGAALSPITGRVMAFGWGCPDDGWNISGVGITDTDNPTPTTEADVIGDFFELFQKAAVGKFHLAGFNIHGFDLSFLVKRAMILGVKVPYQLRPNGQSRFYWPPCFVDLQQVWGVGELRPHGSLDVLCRLMGLGEKSGHGKDFAKLWLDEATRDQASAYLRNDLVLTYKLAERLLQ